MAANKNKKNVKKKAEPMSKRKKIILISVSAVLAAVAIAGFIIGLVNIINAGKTLDFMNDDLSKYVYISEEDYKNYEVNIPLITVEEDDVKREINKLLVKNKSENARFEGSAVNSPEFAITLGDVVNIYYRGYVTDENGVEKELENATNFNSSQYELEIGSGTFIEGFEEGLIGVILNQKEPSFVTKGTVRKDDIVYISYEAILSNGDTEKKSGVRVELGNAGTDALFGEGFSDFLSGKTLGEEIKDQFFKKPGESIDTLYSKIKIEYAVRCETEPITVKAQFPANYGEKSLRGLEVTFDVYPYSAVIYNTPEWNDAFITDKLKETAESLASYEGATLTEKYENKLREELMLKAEMTNDELVEELMWEHYKAKTVVKKLPKNEVDSMYRIYYKTVKDRYDTYSAYFQSLDDCARQYFSLSSNADWRAHIKGLAEQAIREKLVFYYIMREENIFPSDEEFKKLYDEELNSYVDYYAENAHKAELDACKTDEEKAAKLAEIKSEVESLHHSEITESVYYQYALKVMLSYAKRQ